jgi:tetratricopeptide (TPR) repeat protein
MALQKPNHRSSHKPIRKRGKEIKKPSLFKEKINKYDFLFAFLIIIVLGIIIYSNSFKCVFQFDDFNNIVDNVKIRNLADIKAWWNFYPTRPVGVFTFALNYHFNQYNVTYYHLVNLIIHLINALLVWKMVILIFSTPGMKENTLFQYRKSIAFFTATLFVSHPLATQSVTYIVQRMASLAAMFYLFSLVLYVKGRLTENKRITRLLLFTGAFIFAILAILTKENAFTIPFAILLFELCFLQQKFPRINFRDYRVIIGILVFAAFICIIPLKVSFKIFNPIPPSLGHAYTVTPVNYLLTQFRVITTYLRLLLVPVNQIVDYDYPLSVSLFEIKTISSFLFLLIILAGGIILYRKNRILSFGIFWFFLTLSVESGIIPISDVIFEHRTYLPSFGFFLFLTASLYYLIPRKNISFAPIILMAIVIINSFLAHERNKVWKNELTLWTDNVEKSPDKARPYVNLGKAKSHEGDITGGLEAYNKAIRCNPGYADAWFNRGVSKGILKDYQGAIGDYTKAISLESDYEKAYVNRGSIKNILNDNKGAVEDYLKALKEAPDSPTILFNCAMSYHNLGDYTHAIKYYSQAISFQPGFIEAYLKRASVYEAMNDRDAALKDYAKAISMEPGNFQLWFQRGILYYRAGKSGEAISDFTKAIELQPQSSDACYYRAKAFVKVRKYKEAISSFTQALSANPNYFDAYFDKALTEFTVEDYSGAINDFTSAIRLNPQSGFAYSNRGSVKFKSHDTKGACLDWKKAAEMGIEDARNYLSALCK